MVRKAKATQVVSMLLSIVIYSLILKQHYLYYALITAIMIHSLFLVEVVKSTIKSELVPKTNKLLLECQVSIIIVQFKK